MGFITELITGQITRCNRTEGNRDKCRIGCRFTARRAPSGVPIYEFNQGAGVATGLGSQRKRRQACSLFSLQAARRHTPLYTALAFSCCKLILSGFARFYPLMPFSTADLDSGFWGLITFTFNPIRFNQSTLLWVRAYFISTLIAFLWFGTWNNSFYASRREVGFHLIVNINIRNNIENIVM